MKLETWVLFATCSEGQDVLGIWNGDKPDESEVQDAILRLPMYVYGDFRVQLAGSKIPNRRGKDR